MGYTKSVSTTSLMADRPTLSVLLYGFPSPKPLLYSSPLTHSEQKRAAPMSKPIANSRRGRPRKNPVATADQQQSDEQPLMSSEPTEAELEGVEAAVLAGLDLHAGQPAESGSTDAVSLYLRDISRLEAVVLKVHSGWVDPEEVIHAAIQQTTSRLVNHHLQLNLGELPTVSIAR